MMLFRTQRHRAFELRVQPADNGNFLDFVGDLLQRLKLLQPHQQRIVLHQLGCVEQRPRGRHLFTPANQVGLRLLFGSDHLVENVANISGQNDVPESDGAHSNTIDFHLPAYFDRYRFVDVGLLREYLFQGALAERLPYGDLQHAVEVFRHVLQPSAGMGGVDNLIHSRDVHTYGYLVAGEDLLTGDLNSLAAHFEHLDAGRGNDVPEPVAAGSQFAHQSPVEIHEPSLAFVDRCESHSRFATQTHQGRQQKRRNFHIRADIDWLEFHVHRTLPEQHPAGRTDHTRQPAVQIHEGHLRVGGFHYREPARGQRGARADDEVGPLSRIHEFSDVVALQFNALAKGEHPAHSRSQDLSEAALANHQDR